MPCLFPLPRLLLTEFSVGPTPGFSRGGRDFIRRRLQVDVGPRQIQASATGAVHRRAEKRRREFSRRCRWGRLAS